MIHRVRVEPSALTFAVEDGDDVLSAARAAGIVWRSVCGGHAQCRTCWFEVISGVFEPPSPREAEAIRLLLGTTNAIGDLRLACQARLRSDATLRKVGVRKDLP